MKATILGLIGLLTLAIIITGCTPQENNTEGHMNMMDDDDHNIDEHNDDNHHDIEHADDMMAGLQDCGENVGHVHSDDDPCSLDHTHGTVDFPGGAQKVTDFAQLSADKITGMINDKKITLFGYNGMFPGPTLMANQGDEMQVTFTNNLDQETTVHWHGLRHDNKDDGVPGVTQNATQPGETHEYTVKFPDYGAYWYHPHVREDVQQDLGLAGMMIVKPTEDIYNTVDREEVLVLDDILLTDDGIYPYGKEHGTFSLMGRFGNTLLVNGVVDFHTEAKAGEVVRYYIGNVANTRPFNLSFPGATMKLVGGDMSLYEKETLVDSIIIAPAERYIVEVFFNSDQDVEIRHQSPQGYAHLGEIFVKGTVDTNLGNNFEDVRVNDVDIQDYAQYFDQDIDHTITLDINTPTMNMMGDHGSAEETDADIDMMSDQDAGMGMMNDHDETDSDDSMGMMDDSIPMHGEDSEDESNSDMMDDSSMGMMNDHDSEVQSIEWEDDMGMMNMMSNTKTTKWILRNENGQENMDINIRSEVGDKVKIRLINDPDSVHPMQHPIHLHGQRFVVTHINGEPTTNKVWKDTILVPTGDTYDILVDVTNPGKWMMHCHIAEHLEAGMMAGFEVTE